MVGTNLARLIRRSRSILNLSALAMILFLSWPSNYDIAAGLLVSSFHARMHPYKMSKWLSDISIIQPPVRHIDYLLARPFFAGRHDHTIARDHLPPGSIPTCDWDYTKGHYRYSRSGHSVSSLRRIPPCVVSSRSSFTPLESDWLNK